MAKIRQKQIAAPGIIINDQDGTLVKGACNLLTIINPYIILPADDIGRRTTAIFHTDDGNSPVSVTMAKNNFLPVPFLLHNSFILDAQPANSGGSLILRLNKDYGLWFYLTFENWMLEIKPIAEVANFSPSDYITSSRFPELWNE